MVGFVNNNHYWKQTGGVTRVVGGRGGDRLRLVLLVRGDAKRESTLGCVVVILCKAAPTNLCRK